MIDILLLAGYLKAQVHRNRVLSVNEFLKAYGKASHIGNIAITGKDCLTVSNTSSFKVCKALKEKFLFFLFSQLCFIFFYIL